MLQYCAMLPAHNGLVVDLHNLVAIFDFSGIVSWRVVLDIRDTVNAIITGLYVETQLGFAFFKGDKVQRGLAAVPWDQICPGLQSWQDSRAVPLTVESLAPAAGQNDHGGQLWPAPGRI